MNDGIKAPEQGGDDLLAVEIADEALEAAADKSKPAFTLIGSPTVSVLVACCGSSRQCRAGLLREGGEGEEIALLPSKPSWPGLSRRLLR